MKTFRANNSIPVRRESRRVNFAKKTLCLFLSWSLFVVTFPNTVHALARPNIAVLDIKGKGIHLIEADTVTNIIRSELMKSGDVEVLERGEIEKVLEEMGIDEQGKISDEQIFEMGKMLGVSHVLTGRLNQNERTNDLYIQMFDIGNGSANSRFSRTNKRNVDELITSIQHAILDVSGLTSSPDNLFYPPEMTSLHSSIPGDAGNDTYGKEQYGRSYSVRTNDPDQTKSRNQKPRFSIKRNHWIALTGLGLLVTVGFGLGNIISQMDAEGSEIGMPPDFPEVPSP